MIAKVMVNTLNLPKPEWLKYRRNGIGGSEASAIFGKNPWLSIYKVYNDKISEEEPEDIDSLRMWWGRETEALVAKKFEMETGKRVKRCNAILQHPEYPFMIADVDRLIVGEKAGLEVKTTGFDTGEWDEEEVPVQYLIQCLHYLAVTGLDRWYICVMVSNYKFVWKVVERDEELIQMIIDGEKDFWENHVMKLIPPAFDGSEATTAYIDELYPESKGSAVALTSDYEATIKKYLELKAQAKEIKAQYEALENQIKGQLKDAESGYINNYLVNWKTVISNRVDSGLLKEKYPDIYKEVCKESSSRRFDAKTKKESKKK